MPVLFEKPEWWRCEYTERGIFFVHMRPAVVTVEMIDAFMALARPHMQRLAPLKYMNDATDISEAPLSMQWRLARYMRENAPLIAKSGVFGMTPTKAFIARSLARAAGRTNLRVFDTREECEAWLLA
jgi:hypothetical protein